MISEIIVSTWKKKVIVIDNYVGLHIHSMDSNPFSGLEVDSITPFEMYIEKAKEYGMKAIAFTEHGTVLHNIAKRQKCEKAGIKCINAEEFYVTEKIDLNNLKRDNFHCCLYARNYEGVLELNELSSKSFDRADGHFYYNPRITLEELENTSDNILVLTACVAGMLCKGSEEVQDRFLKFIIKNKHRCWLEIQPHLFEKQINYNKHLYEISRKYNIPLIATNDVHAIDNDHIDGRKIMQKSKKISFDEEDACDLTFKPLDKFINAFHIQNSMPEPVYMSAIEETNHFSDIIEPYDLDYSNKYTRLYDNADKEFVDRIQNGIHKRGIDKLPNYETEYLPRIKEELETYRHNDAIDFMLLDSDYKNWLLKNNMHYGCSRGSVSGSEIAYLINCTDVDSVKYKLNFSRFMNSERMSLADVDTDIYKPDRYKVREYLFKRQEEQKGKLYCCNIITFNTIQLKAAIKDVGRAFEMTPEETQSLSDLVEQDDKGNDFMPTNIRKKYPKLFKYVDMVIGTITSIGRHAAGIVCSPTNVDCDFGTLSITSDPRPVSQIDMHEIDSLNYVKLDLLGLNAVGLIDGACKLAEIDFLTPDMVDFTDENVINSIAEDTTLIFQFESGFASESLKKTLSKETITNMKKQNDDISYLDIMAMVNGAIRPAGESYRDALFKGIYKDNGNEVLNKFLAPTLGYLVYQEQIIDFLHLFCGFTMGQADIVRRHFAKKQKNKDGIPMTEIDAPIIENGGYMEDIKGNKDDRYIKGFIAIVKEKYGIEEKEAREAIIYFVRVIKDASSYIFSRNHAVPYSMNGLFIGWLRHYHKIELLTSALNIYKGTTKEEKEKILNIKSYIKSQGIKLCPVKFRKSRSEYFMDKEENAIYQGIASIKFCNSDMAESLYDLKDKKYASFIDFLKNIQQLPVNSRQLDILIKLDFFSEFGGIQYLLDCVDIFNNYYEKGQMKKDKAHELGIDFDLIRACCDKETPKTFMGLNSDKLILELVKRLENKPTSIKEKIAYQTEYLGYIDIIDKKYKGYCVVTELNIDYSPRLTLYPLANGNSLQVKIDKKIFKDKPLARGSIIQVINSYKKPRVKKIDNKWVEQKEKDWWISEYKIC